MGGQPIGRPVEILLVEDNVADARLTQEALKEGGVHSRLHVVPDGEEAVAFLRREGGRADAPRPDVILLDWNLPKMGGREVLAEVKADEGLRRIPVIVLTTSSDERDIEIAYDLRANCFITKPVGLDQFIAVVKAIDRFWFSAVALPSE